MRVASYQFQMQWLATHLEQRAAVDRLQMQVSTGRRILAPSDDPAASARVVELGSSRESATQYAENAGVVRDRQMHEESLLAQGGELLQRARELAVQAANATTTPEAQRAIAVELRQIHDGLLQVVNSVDARGEYVFAGLRTASRPFLASGGTVSFVGDDRQRYVRIGPDQLLPDGDSGEIVFDSVPTGSGRFVARASAANAGALLLGARSLVDASAWDGGTYTVRFLTPASYEIRDASNSLVQSGAYAEGDMLVFRGVALALSGAPAAGDSLTVGQTGTQSVFATIDRLASALEGVGAGLTSRTQAANIVGDSLEDLDRALERIGEVRANVGSRLQAVDRATNALADASLSLTAQISDLRDLDLAAALSTLTNQLTGLDAAQQTYARLQGLSLFNYLR